MPGKDQRHLPRNESLLTKADNIESKEMNVSEQKAKKADVE